MVDSKFIMAGVIILLILYIIITYIFSDRKIIRKEVLQSNDAEASKIISADQIPSRPGVTDFTVSFWLYIDKYGTNSHATFDILKKYNTADEETGNIFKISANQNKNDIDFYIHTSSDDTLTNSRLTLENIYLQKWVHIIMTVETRNLDIYLNGKLEETLILDSLPYEYTNSETCEFKLLEGLDDDSIEMKISNVQYFTRSVAPREAWTLYKEGYRNMGILDYLVSLFSGYQINFSFKKSGQKITEFSLGG